MAGERRTNKALEQTWHTHQGPTDGVQSNSSSQITIIGVGGAADLAIAPLVELGSSITHTVAIDLDPPRLGRSEASTKILITRELVKEISADPGIPPHHFMAREAMQQIEATLAASNIVFISARSGDEMGLKTASIVAGAARAKEAITLCLVTQDSRPGEALLPSTFEKISELRNNSDMVVVIDQSRLTQLAHEISPNEETCVGQIQAYIIKGLSELFSKNWPNGDRTEISNAARSGELAAAAKREDIASKQIQDVVLMALNHPLLDFSRAEAKNLLIHVTADNLMTAEEAHSHGDAFNEVLEGRAQIVWGESTDSGMGGVVRVVLRPTGLPVQITPKGLSLAASQLYNLDPGSKSEQKLSLELGLYQLEDFES